MRNKDAEAAEKASREAIDILQRLAKNRQPAANIRTIWHSATTTWPRSKSQRRLERGHRCPQRASSCRNKCPQKPGHRPAPQRLAISLNNLGVAYCKAAKPAEADAAFERARELFATLANDYPDELAYRSLLAAQLNNQALALAKAGRHADALPIYTAAIEAQKICLDQAPNSEQLRDALSKMYFNFGQSLRHREQWHEAMDAALARRELWKASGERLLGVAAELAELDIAMPQHLAGTDKKETSSELEAAVLSTLQQAYDCGWPRKIDPATDAKFACFNRNERYAAKLAQLNEQSSATTPKQFDQSRASNTKAN